MDAIKNVGGSLLRFAQLSTPAAGRRSEPPPDPRNPRESAATP